MLWLQSSIKTVAHALWYSPCATIRSGYWTSIPEPVRAPRPIRRTAFRIVALASRLSVSPNAYRFGAPLASTPVARSRVSWRPTLLWPTDPSRSRSAR